MGAGHAGDARAGCGSVAGRITRAQQFTLETTVTYDGLDEDLEDRDGREVYSDRGSAFAAFASSRSCYVA